MNFANLNRAIKYVFWDRTDWYPKLVGSKADPFDRHSHEIFADWVADKGDHALGEKIREEVLKGRMPYLPNSTKRQELRDRAVEDIREHHPSATVRAMAHEPAPDSPYPFHPDLVDILHHSDRIQDKDLFATVAPEDPMHEHPPLKTTLQEDYYDQSGLEPRVIRGKLYLLDHTKPDPKAFNVPHVVAEANVGDQAELAKLHTEARRIADQRHGVNQAMNIGPAHVSEPEFTSL